MSKWYIVKVINRKVPYYLSHKGIGWVWSPNKEDAFTFRSYASAENLGKLADRRMNQDTREVEIIWQ